MDSLAPACPAVAALERRPPPPATGQFKRDYRRESRGRHGAFLDSSLVPVVEILANDHPLEARHHDHGLSGEWRDHRDCHVKPDLVLTRTTARGSLEFRPGALRDARRGPGRRCRPEPDIEVVARRPTGATRCRRPSTWPDNRADRHRDAADDRPRACGRTGPPGPVDSRHRADHVRPPQRYLRRALDAAAAGYPLKDAPSASRRRSRSAVRVAGGSRTRQTVWTPSPSLSVGARQICEMPLQAAFADGPDGPGGRCRVGEAGGVRGGPRLSGPRQVCDPGVAHPAGRGGRPTRCRVDGVAAIPAAGDDSIPGDSASGNLQLSSPPGGAGPAYS